MYHLCTTAIFRTIYHKRKILDIRLNIKDFSSVGVTGFEPATTRPPVLRLSKAGGGHFTARPILFAASLSQVLSLLFRAAHVVWRLDRLIPFAAIFAVPFTAHCLRLAISLYHTDPDSNRSDREVSPITHRIIHNDSYLEITM